MCHALFLCRVHMLAMQTHGARYKNFQQVVYQHQRQRRLEVKSPLGTSPLQKLCTQPCLASSSLCGGRAWMTIGEVQIAFPLKPLAL